MAKTVRLDEVCTLATDRTCDMTSAQRALRQGPYPLYAGNLDRIEDWEFEAGGTVMVPAYGSVLASDGRLIAFFEEGRCAATRQMLPLLPRDPADGRYICRVLTTTKAPTTCVGGSPQLRETSASSLMRIAIPWPGRDARDAYVDALDALERRIAEAKDAVPRLLAEGDAAFAETVSSAGAQPRPLRDLAAWRSGTNVPIADRGVEKPVAIEGPAGALGRCDEALSEGRCIVLGPAARKVLARVCPGPCHPIAETLFANDADCAVPLPVLFFALRAAGVPDRARLDGAELPGAAKTVEQAMGLAVCAGDGARWEAFAEKAEQILARIDEADGERERATRERVALIEDFERTGCDAGDGDGCHDPADRAPAPLPDRDGDPAPRHAAPRPARDGRPRPLCRIAEGVAGSCGLPVEDAAWEVAPLAMLRARLNPGLWDALVSMARGVPDGPSDVDLARFVDVALADLASRERLLSFVGGFTYAESALDARGLAQVLVELDGLSPASLDGPSIRALFSPEAARSEQAAQVRTLVETVARACSADIAGRGLVEMAYVPADPTGLMADAAGLASPGHTLAVQSPDIMDALADAFVRDRLRATADVAGGDFAYAEGDPLACDAFPTLRASLVLADLPPNARDWSPAAVDPNDPRWLLGTPPRNKANYAWLQHCLAHLTAGGLAVVLATNAPLHSSVGSEAQLRRELAASGRLRAVVSLPSRMGAADDPARSLLVLGDAQPAEKWRCLMVNALDEGLPSADNPARRVLAESTLDEVCRLCADWVGQGRVAGAAVPHAIVGAAEVEAGDWLLTPWTYARNRTARP